MTELSFRGQLGKEINCSATTDCQLECSSVLLGFCGLFFFFFYKIFPEINCLYTMTHYSELAGGTTEHSHTSSVFTAVWQGSKHSEKPVYKSLLCPRVKTVMLLKKLSYQKCKQTQRTGPECLASPTIHTKESIACFVITKTEQKAQFYQVRQSYCLSSCSTLLGALAEI